MPIWSAARARRPYVVTSAERRFTHVTQLIRQRRSVTDGRRHCAAPVGGGAGARSRSFSSGWPCWLARLSALT